MANSDNLNNKQKHPSDESEAGVSEQLERFPGAEEPGDKEKLEQQEYELKEKQRQQEMRRQRAMLRQQNAQRQQLLQQQRPQQQQQEWDRNR